MLKALKAMGALLISVHMRKTKVQPRMVEAVLLPS